ncbi:MAG TPA: Fur family transcriptional regulator [Gaiellaceae bacterium]|nr:Fur family transcriptional regulator [Gaiellaceae bacterium]
MTWSAHAQLVLRNAGLKPGGARSAVVEVLGQQRCCLPAAEIHDEVRRRRPGVGIASVYRALETLTALGLVHRIDLRSGGARYEPAAPSGDHHHHLVCGDCGKVEAFSDDGLERAIHTVSQAASFRIDEHEVVLRGRCETCA